ncbi:MAG: DNA primase [Actinomycetota bacterium]
MGWSREFIEKVREATDLTDVAGDYGDTKNAGPGKVKMTCPLPNHSDKTPSHNVQKEFFKCFGCGEGGDCFEFIMAVENCDFNESVKRLAGRAGIVPGSDDWVGGSGGEDKRKDLFVAVEMASAIYKARLPDRENKEAQQARNFLRDRAPQRARDQALGEMCEENGIGYSYPRAPGLSNGLTKELTKKLTEYFKKTGIKEVEIPKKIENTLKRAGLASEYEGNLTDFFFGERIMFTIFDSSDRPIAFSGRQLPQGRDPKYRNSPETEIYKKNEILYGLNWSKKHVAKEDRIIICEGQLDVIAFRESSLPVAVAPCGTSITENQVKKLARYTNNFILCFDSDNAGQKAANRFVQWEEKYDLQIKVALLPDGTDPGDYLAQDNLDELVETVEEAIPFLRWRINRVLEEEKTETIEERVNAANRSLQIVRDHPEEMYWDDYVRYIGQCLSHEYSELRKKFDKMDKTPERKPFQPTQPDTNSATPQVLVEQKKPNPAAKETKQSTTLALNVLSLVLHNRRTLEQGKILPEKLQSMFFPTSAFSRVFEALLVSQNIDQAENLVKDAEEEKQIFLGLRESKPDDLVNDISASKQVGELLIRRVKNELDQLRKDALESDNLQLMRGLGDVHNAQNTMQDGGYNLFSSEADFLIEWLRERLEQ